MIVNPVECRRAQDRVEGIDKGKTSAISSNEVHVVRARGEGLIANPVRTWERARRRLTQHRLGAIDGDDGSQPQCRGELRSQTTRPTAEIEDTFTCARCEPLQHTPAPPELRVGQQVIARRIPISHNRSVRPGP